MEPADLHAAVVDRLAAGDVDGLVDLYEPDAVYVRADGTEAVGTDEIRAVWEETISLGSRLRLSTRYVHVQGDLAMLSSGWHVELAEGPSRSAVSVEVARRQPDGTWRYVLDRPHGAPG